MGASCPVCQQDSVTLTGSAVLLNIDDEVVICAYSHSNTFSSPASYGLTCEGKDSLCKCKCVRLYVREEHSIDDEATIFRSITPRCVSVMMNLGCQLERILNPLGETAGGGVSMRFPDRFN